MREVAEIVQIRIYACDDEIIGLFVDRAQNGGGKGEGEREGNRTLSKLYHIEIHSLWMTKTTHTKYELCTDRSHYLEKIKLKCFIWSVHLQNERIKTLLAVAVSARGKCVGGSRRGTDGGGKDEAKKELEKERELQWGDERKEMLLVASWQLAVGSWHVIKLM